jgi:hypothetical protein
MPTKKIDLLSENLLLTAASGCWQLCLLGGANITKLRPLASKRGGREGHHLVRRLCCPACCAVAQGSGGALPG